MVASTCSQNVISGSSSDGDTPVSMSVPARPFTMAPMQGCDVVPACSDTNASISHSINQYTSHLQVPGKESGRHITHISYVLYSSAGGRHCDWCSLTD